eukprot:TRINITY_DN1498_c0_g1_i3.p1 TRINITY_DN1498_c0_g1~~TRINITY_DN1498_c0_g1_i3.p1  ORF type:complete len:813 (+),score=277.68 TRINITY_DN1498_c0_g1_i3:229-2439(+)
MSESILKEDKSDKNHLINITKSACNLVTEIVKYDTEKSMSLDQGKQRDKLELRENLISLVSLSRLYLINPSDRITKNKFLLTVHHVYRVLIQLYVQPSSPIYSSINLRPEIEALKEYALLQQQDEEQQQQIQQQQQNKSVEENTFNTESTIVSDTTPAVPEETKTPTTTNNKPIPNKNDTSSPLSPKPQNQSGGSLAGLGGHRSRGGIGSVSYVPTSPHPPSSHFNTTLSPISSNNHSTPIGSTPEQDENTNNNEDFDDSFDEDDDDVNETQTNASSSNNPSSIEKLSSDEISDAIDTEFSSKVVKIIKEICVQDWPSLEENAKDNFELQIKRHLLTYKQLVLNANNNPTANVSPAQPAGLGATSSTLTLDQLSTAMIASQQQQQHLIMLQKNKSLSSINLNSNAGSGSADAGKGKKGQVIPGGAGGALQYSYLNMAPNPSSPRSRVGRSLMDSVLSLMKELYTFITHFNDNLPGLIIKMDARDDTVDQSIKTKVLFEIKKIELLLREISEKWIFSVANQASPQSVAAPIRTRLGSDLDGLTTAISTDSTSQTIADRVDSKLLPKGQYIRFMKKQALSAVLYNAGVLYHSTSQLISAVATYEGDKESISSGGSGLSSPSVSQPTLSPTTSQSSLPSLNSTVSSDLLYLSALVTVHTQAVKEITMDIKTFVYLLIEENKMMSNLEKQLQLQLSTPPTIPVYTNPIVKDLELEQQQNKGNVDRPGTINSLIIRLINAS